MTESEIMISSRVLSSLLRFALVCWLLHALVGLLVASAPDKLGGVYVQGDIIIGGLFPVHAKSKTNDKVCSHKVYDRGIQRLEAMLYAIDKINRDDSILR